MQTPPTVVFDLGNVLIRWDPRNLYRTLFDDETEMETFLSEVCSPAWNEEQDRGRLWEDAIAEAIARHPQEEKRIRAYDERWEETIIGAIEETVAILDELRSKHIRLLALTNWSAEKFPVALERYPFLQWFEGILVSGEEKLIKPDPAIFELLASRYRLDPARTVFIDDSMRNIDSAASLGFIALHFTDAEKLRKDLIAKGLPLAHAGT